MSKPILKVQLVAQDGSSRTVQAVVDSGSFESFVRDDCLPAGAVLIPFVRPKKYGLASKTGRFQASGTTVLEIRIGRRWIDDHVIVSPDLRCEMLIGAGTMQRWDISIRNKNGSTSIHVGRDNRDPNLLAVE